KRRVDDPIDLRRKLFQRTEVRGRDRKRSARRQRLKNGSAQCRSFDWICAGPELVDENERVFSRRAEHLREILDVRAEGRQARKDRLLVADVGVDVVDDGDPGSGIYRRWNPRLYQGGEKPQRF